jgi:cytochrome c oxidase subunit IV
MERPATAHQHPASEHGHVVPVPVYLGVFVALLVLTGITVWAARHDFGALNTPVALGIAVLKAVLVILFFMHVKYSPRLTKLVVASAFVWLAIMIVGTLQDYYSPHINSSERAPALSRE